MTIYRLILTLISFSLPSILLAQSDTFVYWEPEFEMKISTESPWSYSFGIVNRSLHYKEVAGETSNDYNQEHIELNHFTTYKTSSNTSFALGLRYRFREIFNDSRYDEMRTVEQFVYKHPGSSIGLAHRLRTEQRFLNVVTVHRFRYRLAVSQPLGEDFLVGLSTEALYSVANERKPELEQRISLEFENSSLKNIDISLGVEYQHENYIYDLEKEFFLSTGITLNL